ncbi:MAG: hypothetical protein JNK15_16265 [Planctomycetes bacterium]|nr:hypothetical protein [Planctomycetota bacterium]
MTRRLLFRSLRAPLVLALAAAACSPPPPPPPPTLLTVDGIEIRSEDLAPYVAWLDTATPDLGPRQKVARALDEYVLPLRLAQRAFAAERAQQKQLAEAMRHGAADFAALDRAAIAPANRARGEVSPAQAPLPAGRFLFDPANLDKVGEPIELPRGFALFAVRGHGKIQPNGSLASHADVLQVDFPTHTASQWDEWYAAQKKQLVGKVTHVDPEWIHAVPDWLDTGKLLVIDGIEITHRDVAPYVVWLDSYLPEGGLKAKVRRALDDHLLPVRVAQRSFAKERAEQRQRADALRSVATNIEELDRATAQMASRRRSNVSRSKVHLPVAMFLFDPLNVRGTSQPIELPMGWFVVGAFDLVESPAQMLDDYCDALQVGFVTHTADQWRTFYDAQRLELAAKVTWVDPAWVSALPDWIKPPKTKD